MLLLYPLTDTGILIITVGMRIGAVVHYTALSDGKSPLRSTVRYYNFLAMKKKTHRFISYGL